MCEHRGNKTRFARRRVYTVSSQTVELPFSTCKCDEMHLRWVFTTCRSPSVLREVLRFTYFQYAFFRAQSTKAQYSSVNNNDLKKKKNINIPNFSRRPYIVDSIAKRVWRQEWSLFHTQIACLLGYTLVTFRQTNKFHLDQSEVGSIPVFSHVHPLCLYFPACPVIRISGSQPPSTIASRSSPNC